MGEKLESRVSFKRKLKTNHGNGIGTTCVQHPTNAEATEMHPTKVNKIFQKSGKTIYKYNFLLLMMKRSTTITRRTSKS